MFDDDGKIFYTPQHIEIGHEFIHIKHNNKGSNRANLSTLTTDEMMTWRDPEEYWTMREGNISEDKLNKESGFPSRHGHHGLPVTFFTEPEDENKNLDTLLKRALG